MGETSDWDWTTTEPVNGPAAAATGMVLHGGMHALPSGRLVMPATVARLHADGRGECVDRYRAAVIFWKAYDFADRREPAIKVRLSERAVVTLLPGVVEYAPDYHPDETSRAVWQAIADTDPWRGDGLPLTPRDVL